MTSTIITTPATTVSVRGSAHLEVEPDAATVSFSAQANASTAARALDDASRIADQCRTALAAVDGVRSSQIGRVHVGKRRHWSEKQQRWIKDGYDATVSGSADIDTAEVGAVVKALVTAGADVGWVNWWLDADNPAHREVRKLAVAEAHAAAVDFADAVGAPLGALVTLADPGLLGAGVPTGFEPFADRAMAVASAAPITPADELDLDPEVQEIDARVEACFALTK